MRLTGSLTEERIRGELAALQRHFVSHPRFEQITEAIRERVPDANSALAWEWFPDNGEDVFTILVNGKHLIGIEFDPQPGTELEVLYHKGTNQGVKRMDQIKLAVALDMASEVSLEP